MNNDKTEQPIPDHWTGKEEIPISSEFLATVYDVADDFGKSMDNYLGPLKIADYGFRKGAYWAYRALHSLPPSPVGYKTKQEILGNHELGHVFTEYYSKARALEAMQAYADQEVAVARLSPVGETGPVFRFVKATEREPPSDQTKDLHIKFNGQFAHIFRFFNGFFHRKDINGEWGKNPIDRHSAECIEWLEEIPPTPAPEVKEEKETLSQKMKRFFAETLHEEILAEWKKLGYEFEDISKDTPEQKDL